MYAMLLLPPSLSPPSQGPPPSYLLLPSLKVAFRELGRKEEEGPLTSLPSPPSKHSIWVFIFFHATRQGCFAFYLLCMYRC